MGRRAGINQSEKGLLSKDGKTSRKEGVLFEKNELNMQESSPKKTTNIAKSDFNQKKGIAYINAYIIKTTF